MATMELASIPRELPQFGRHLSSLSRPASEVFGQQGAGNGKGPCGCGARNISCGCARGKGLSGCGGGNGSHEPSATCPQCRHLSTADAGDTGTGGDLPRPETGCDPCLHLHSAAMAACSPGCDTIHCRNLVQIYAECQRSLGLQDCPSVACPPFARTQGNRRPTSSNLCQATFAGTQCCISVYCDWPVQDIPYLGAFFHCRIFSSSCSGEGTMIELSPSGLSRGTNDMLIVTPSAAKPAGPPHIEVCDDCLWGGCLEGYVSPLCSCINRAAEEYPLRRTEPGDWFNHNGTPLTPAQIIDQILRVTEFPAYRVTGANSNTFIKTILQECGIDTPTPQVNAPGWSVNLETYLSRRKQWLRGRSPR